MKIKQYVNQSLIMAIGFGYDAIWRDLNSKLKVESCNLLQAILLISLFFEDEEVVTPSQIAEIFGTTRANVSHCISHLEKLKFLRRSLDQTDARSYRLSLRPEGRKTALRLIKIIDELENRFEKVLGKAGVQTTIEAIRTAAQCGSKPRGES